MLDPDGTERWRLEGYYANRPFRAALEMGLARVWVMRKRWEDAQARYSRIVAEYGDTSSAPDALYWRYVSEYSRTHDAEALRQACRELQRRYPGSEAAMKSSVWTA